MKRVVITGAGTINALGLSVPATLEAMREGRCGIGELAFRDVERLQIQIGGQVRGFEAECRYNRQQMSLYDRFTQFTLAAAKEAIEQSGLIFSGELAARSGVVLGTAGGGVSTWAWNGTSRGRPLPSRPPVLRPITRWHRPLPWSGPAWRLRWSRGDRNPCCALAGSRRGRGCG